MIGKAKESAFVFRSHASCIGWGFGDLSSPLPGGQRVLANGRAFWQKDNAF